jgi:hypothetical protein
MALLQITKYEVALAVPADAPPRGTTVVESYSSMSSGGLHAMPGTNGAETSGRIGVEVVVECIQIIPLMHETVGDSNREHRVIGKPAVGGE